MSAIRLVEIGLTLGDLYKASAVHRYQDWQCNQRLEKRKAEITPAEGWPGKNDKERKSGEEKAYLVDEIIQKSLSDLAELRADLAQTDAEIQALEAERRSLEWGIRSQMIGALTQAHIDANGRGDPAERAFDDAGQALTDQELEDLSRANRAEDAIRSEIPF